MNRTEQRDNEQYAYEAENRLHYLPTKALVKRAEGSIRPLGWTMTAWTRPKTYTSDEQIQVTSLAAAVRP